MPVIRQGKWFITILRGVIRDGEEENLNRRIGLRKASDREFSQQFAPRPARPISNHINRDFPRFRECGQIDFHTETKKHPSLWGKTRLLFAIISANLA